MAPRRNPPPPSPPWPAPRLPCRCLACCRPGAPTWPPPSPISSPRSTTPTCRHWPAPSPAATTPAPGRSSWPTRWRRPPNGSAMWPTGRSSRAWPLPTRRPPPARCLCIPVSGRSTAKWSRTCSPTPPSSGIGLPNLTALSISNPAGRSGTSSLMTNKRTTRKPPRWPSPPSRSPSPTTSPPWAPPRRPWWACPWVRLPPPTPPVASVPRTPCSSPATGPGSWGRGKSPCPRISWVPWRWWSFRWSSSTISLPKTPILPALNPPFTQVRA